jgi:hypothetical protein
MPNHPLAEEEFDPVHPAKQPPPLRKPPTSLHLSTHLLIPTSHTNTSHSLLSVISSLSLRQNMPEMPVVVGRVRVAIDALEGEMVEGEVDVEFFQSKR